MNIYIWSFVIFIGFFIFAGIGVLIADKRLKGSCGGLGRVMGEEDKPCNFCGKPPEECEKKQKLLKLNIL